MKSTKKMTFSAIMAATAVALLFFAGLLPTLSATIAVFAGFCVAVTMLECGRNYAILCYITASVLSLFFVSDMSVPMMFILLFGLYPIFKAVAEQQRTRLLEYILKFAFCNVALLLFYLLLQLFAALPDSRFPYWALLLPLNLVFWLYDYAFSRMVVLYRYYRNRPKR